MLKQPRFRLSADPSIGVTDLMEPLSKYMEEKGDRNLIKLLHVSPTFSWKSAPDITFLSEHAPLFQRYAKIAPNSMLPPKKNKTAIERLDQQMKCNFSKQSTSDYVDLVDNIVRTAMKQYRDLAKDPHAKERAYRGLTLRLRRHHLQVRSWIKTLRSRLLCQIHLHHHANRL